MKKRGQITIFILLGLFVLLLFGFLIVSIRSGESEQAAVGDRTQEAALRSYVNSCIDRQVKEGIYYFGLGPFAPSQIRYYINRNLADCADFSLFRKQGIRVTTGDVSSRVAISPRALEVQVNYPIILEDNKETYKIEKFDYSLSRVVIVSEASFTPTGNAILEDKIVSKLGAELKIPKGSDITGSGELKVEDRKFEAKTNDIVVGNLAYKISDAAFSPFAELTITYQENDVPKDYPKDMLSIAKLDEQNDVWVAFESATDQNLKKVSAKIKASGTYAIVVGCKSTTTSQLNYTGWLYREQVSSSDKSLLNPKWDESSKSPTIFALKEHKQLKLSGGSGWNDNNARAQIGTPKVKVDSSKIKDWDMDDQSENSAECPGCNRDIEKCKPLCKIKAKTAHKSAYGREDQGNGFLYFNNDAIKDGFVSQCDSEKCYCSGNPESCSQCPKSCISEYAVGGNLATPNNYGYEKADDVSGKGEFDIRLQPSGNTCIGIDGLRIDLKSSSNDAPPESAGFCNDECKAMLNSKDVNVDANPIKDPLIKSGANRLEVEILNKKDPASYARGVIELKPGTGLYKRCNPGEEIKENCLCGTTNANVLEDKKQSDSDYGEYDVKVKEKKVCCDDGSVVTGACAQKAPCRTDKNSPLESKDTGCVCGAATYNFNTDGAGFCCPVQTCDGQRCTPGAGLGTAKESKNDLEVHEYKLELKGGIYSAYMDGRLLKSMPSSERPKGIDFGNNLRPTSAVGTWTSMKIDFIKITDGSGTAIFTEEFEGTAVDPAKWIVDLGAGSAQVSGGSVLLQSPGSNKFPWIKSKNDIFPATGNFILTVKMQYPSVTGHGTYVWTSPQVFGIGQDDSAPGGEKHGQYRLRVYLLNDMVYACGGIGGCGKKTCEPTASTSSPGTSGTAGSPGSGCEKPNKFGVHLMPEYDASAFGRQLDKAKELVGECGFVKNVAQDVGASPDVPKWAEFVKQANQRKLVPILRLQGVHAGAWQKPDPANGYSTVAGKYVEFIKQVERSSGSKVKYVEIWNEPNLGKEEWGGAANPQEYSDFLLAVAKAIKAADGSIKVMNGGLAVTGETADGHYQTKAFIEAMFVKNSELKNYIDVWASHPYPPHENYYKDELNQLSTVGFRPKVLLSEISFTREDGLVKSPEEFKNIMKNWVSDNDVEGVVVWLLVSETEWKKYSLVDSNMNGNAYFDAIKSLRESMAGSSTTAPVPSGLGANIIASSTAKVNTDITISAAVSVPSGGLQGAEIWVKKDEGLATSWGCISELSQDRTSCLIAKAASSSLSTYKFENIKWKPTTAGKYLIYATVKSSSGACSSSGLDSSVCTGTSKVAIEVSQ